VGVFHANAFFSKVEFSDISVAMSSTKLYTTCFDDVAYLGIMPDIAIQPSVIDKVNGFNSPLKYCKRLIRRKLPEE